jgi:hypothetical protein
MEKPPPSKKVPFFSSFPQRSTAIGEMDYERICGEIPDRREESTRNRNLSRLARDENKNLHLDGCVLGFCRLYAISEKG